jgi:hypothetical protein
MRHILALLAVLVLAGVCLAAEFNLDEAKKAHADYLAALEAAKSKYGQALVEAKVDLDARAAAATDAIPKQALENESAAISDEVVQLRKPDAGTFQPRVWKSDQPRKAKVAYLAELKSCAVKYAQDLAKVRLAILAKKSTNADGTVRETFQKEADIIAEEIEQLRGEPRGATPEKGTGTTIGLSTTKPSGNTVNLLKIVDLARDRIRGTWNWTDGVLVSGPESVLGIPYEPPQEYDFIMEFQTDSTLISPRLTKGETAFWWGMKGWSHVLCGFYWIDGKHLDNNPTRTNFPMKNGVKYLCEVRVRNDGLTALVDGKVITEFKTDYKNLGDDYGYAFAPRALGLFVYKHTAKIFRMEVREVTGKGRVIPSGRAGG